MFLVSDGRQLIERRIREWSTREPSVGLVMAAVYFEWTLSRAILCLSTSPNVDVRSALQRAHGLEKYKDLWKQEVPDAKLTAIIRDWSGLKAAFKARNLLVHGRDRCTSKMAAPHMASLFAAAKDLWEYCDKEGHNLGSRLPIRRRRQVDGSSLRQTRARSHREPA